MIRKSFFTGMIPFLILLFLLFLGNNSGFATDLNKPAPNAAPFNLSFVLSDYNGVGVSCNGAGDGSVDMTINGGTSPFSILWSNGAVTEDISGLTAGIYVVTVIDADQDTVIESVQLTEPDPVSVSINTLDSVSCYNLADGSINIDVAGGVGGFQFVWSNGSLLEDITGLIAGNYSVTVTDDNGCIGTLDTSVYQPDSIDLGMVTVDANAAPDGIASLNPTGGTQPYSYLWSTGETTSSIFNLLPGLYTVTLTDANSCTATQVAVINNALGSCTILTDSVNNVSCIGLSDGAIYIDVFATIAPVTYLWSNGAVTQDITGLPAGTYTVTITDVILCNDIQTFTITQPDSILIVFSTDNETCNNDNGTATAFPAGGTPGFTYLWSNAATSATITGLTGGSYTVTVTDANGCTSVDTADIISLIPPQIIVDSTFNVLCNGGNNGGAYMSVLDGNLPFTYLWSNGNTNEDIPTGLTAGTYTVTVTDDDLCTDTQSVIITQPPALNDSVQTVNPACGINNGSITIFPYDGTSPYSFLWSNSQTTQTISGLSPGSYTVTVTDANLCTKQRVITILNQTGPVAVVDSVRNVRCFGGSTGGVFISTTGGTVPLTYLWSNSAVTQDLTNVPIGTYTVTVTDANLCTSVVSGTVNQPAAALNDSVRVTNARCGLNNGSVIVYPYNGTAPYTYLWSNSQTTQTISALAAGTYTVTITDANLCTRQRVASLINIAGPVAALDSVRNVRCFGGATGGVFISVSGGTNPLSYLWSNSAVSQDISSVLAGTYTVTVTDANLCTSVVSGTVTQPAAALNDSVRVTNTSCGLNNGSAIVYPYNGTAPYTYLWSNAQTTQTISNLAVGTYTVTITDANLCTRQRVATVINISGPVASIDSIRNVRCFGGATGGVFISVTGGTNPLSYLWSNSAVSQDINNVIAGTYTVTVTDANLCTSVVSGTVTQPLAALNDSVNVTNARCGLNNGSVTVYPYNGTSPYTYLWSNSQATQTISNLAPGTYTVTISDANLCTRQRVSVVTNIPGPVAVIDSVRNVKCFGGVTGGVFISVTGGTAPLSYLWSNSAVSQDITGVASGTYTVTVTDANLCTSTVSALVSQPIAALNDSVQIINATCNTANGSITVFPYNGTGPYSYLWNNSQTTQSINSLASGVYTVTITDANQCTKTRTANVSNIGAPVIAMDSLRNVRCFGGATGGVFISVTGGAIPYTYLWSNSAVSQDINNVIAGNYTVTVTDFNNCQAIFDTTVTQPLAALNDSVRITNASCGLNNGSVIVYPYGGTSPYTYLWSNSQTTQTISALAAGTYTVTVTDANLCTRQRVATVINVAGPVAAVDSVRSVRCFGGATGGVFISVTGGTNPLTYLWSNSAITQDISNVSAGTYTVTVTDANLCTSVVIATVTQPLAALNDSVNVTNSSCGIANGSITVFPYNGTSPYSYLWNTSQTTQTISNLTSGTYTVTITDANLCTRLRTALVGSAGSPLVVIDSVRNVRCNGGVTGGVFISVTGGTNPISYLWSNGSITQDITNVIAGNYTVTVTDASNCSVTVDSTVSQPLPVDPNNVVTNSTCGLANGSITSTPSGGVGPYTFLWSNGGVTSVISGLIPGTYTVTVTDANLCSAIESSIVGSSAGPIAVIDSVRNVRCNGAATGGIFISVSGGTIPYTYLWSNAAVSQDLTNVIAGTYTVTITDFNTCSSSVSATITQPAVLNDSIQVLDATCGAPTGSATVFPFGGTSPYSFLWSTGSTSATIFNLNAGNYTVTITDFNGCTEQSVANISSIGGPLVVVDSIHNVKCFGQANGGIFISVSGGSTPYTYLWSNGALTQDINNVLAGTYTVTVSDSNSCSVILSGNITQPPVLNDSISVVNSSCGLSNGSVTTFPYGGTSPYSFVWNGGQITQTVTPLAAGIYTVTVTDFNGCTVVKSDTIFTSLNPSVVIDSVINVSCNGGNNGKIYITASGGTAPLTYLWSNSAVTPDITGLIAATYTVTVTDLLSCSSSASATVTQPAVLNDSTQITPEACNALNGSVKVFPYGGTAPYSYLWNTSATTQIITGLQSGTYTVTITDSKGCTKVQTAVVPLSGAPVVSLDSLHNASCNGLNDGGIFISVSGGTSPYTYLWSNGSIIQDNVNLIAGVYSLILTDQLLCRDTSYYTVTQPDLLQDSVTTNSTSCGLPNGSATVFPFGGTPSYNYLWSNGQTGQTVINLPAGLYTVTITDANLCTHVETASISQIPVQVISTDSIIDPTCNGSSDGAIYISVTSGEAPYTYLWSNSDVTQDIQGLSAGVYTVTVTDNNNCSLSQAFTVTDPLPLTDSTNVLNTTCGQSNGTATIFPIGGSTPYSYLWSTNSTSQTIFGLASGVYTVTVTDSLGCTLTVNIPVGDLGGPVIALDSIANVSCNGNSDGGIFISVTSGSSPYLYSWSNSQFTEDITGLISGTYSVTVTDQSNCQQFATYVVTEPAVLSDSSHVTDATCGLSNGSIIVYPVGGSFPYTYLWSNNATTQTISNLNPGTYTVTITDASQCTYSSQYVLNNIAGPSLVVDSVKQVLCFGDSTGAVFVTASGGTPPYSYLWSDGSTVEDITNVNSGTYTVTVTDFNGCTASVFGLITEPPAITASFTVVDANCNTSNGSITSIVSGGVPGYVYLWNTNATTNSISNLSAGVYTLTVTDQNNCVKRFNPFVNNISAPTISVVDSGNVTCAGLSNGFITVTVTGGAVPYNYSWTNTVQTGNQLINLPGNITYTLTITDNLGCIAIRPVLITEPQPIVITSTVPQLNNNYNLSCAGSNDGSIAIVVSGGTGLYTYLWSNLATAQNIGGLSAGSYTVTVTDANGCTESDSFTLTQPPLLISNAGSNKVVCGINSDTLNAVPPAFGTGYWIVVSGSGVFADSTQSNTIVSNLANGVNVFQWIVTDGICSAFSQVVITFNTQIEAIAGINKEVCENSILLTATAPQFGFGYWRVENSAGEIDDSTQAVTMATGLNPGPNVFKWTVINGTCSDSASVIIFVKDPEDCFETLEMPTGFTPNEDGKNDVFFIKGIDDYPENSLVIYNRWGNKVFEKSGYKNDWDGVNESGEPLPDGTYFVIFKVMKLDKILTNYVDLRR